MKSEIIRLTLDGREVVIHQATQEVSVLNTDGTEVSRERIQVAAGSVQGIFSAVEGVASPFAGRGRNA